MLGLSKILIHISLSMLLCRFLGFDHSFEHSLGFEHSFKDKFL